MLDVSMVDQMLPPRLGTINVVNDAEKWRRPLNHHGRKARDTGHLIAKKMKSIALYVTFGFIRVSHTNFISGRSCATLLSWPLI